MQHFKEVMVTIIPLTAFHIQRSELSIEMLHNYEPESASYAVFWNSIYWLIDQIVQPGVHGGFCNPWITLFPLN